MRAKKEEGRPISSSLREFQHGAFAIKTIRARSMKTPALQAKTLFILVTPVIIDRKPYISSRKVPIMQMDQKDFWL